MHATQTLTDLDITGPPQVSGQVFLHSREGALQQGDRFDRAAEFHTPNLSATTDNFRAGNPYPARDPQHSIEDFWIMLETETVTGTSTVPRRTTKVRRPPQPTTALGVRS